MKTTMLLCGVLLASAAMAAPKTKVVKTQSELEKRIASGALMKIVIGDAVISMPPQLMQIHADSFSYKPGVDSKTTPAGITVLSTGTVKPVVEIGVGSDGNPTSTITAPEIEVETALTQIVIDAGEQTILRWDLLADAIKAAPQSPRFRLNSYSSAFGLTDSLTLVYDRRSKNLYEVSTNEQRYGDTQTTQSTEKNITDAEIEKRAALFQEAFGTLKSSETK